MQLDALAFLIVQPRRRLTQLARKLFPAIRSVAGFEVSTAKGATAMLRRSIVSLVVLVLVAGIACAATLEGTIKQVDSDKSTLVVTGKDKKEVTVTVNKDAKITLDGKKAKVTHEDKKASEIEAKSGYFLLTVDLPFELLPAARTSN
jgi:hypothetical protein